MAKLKCGLIQMGLKGDGSMAPDEIRDRMIEAHIPFIEDAAKQGVQVLCFQEVFTQPYFCPSQDRKWYAAAEKIPDGHTTKLMTEYAKKHNMVIVVPIYEETMPGVYYNAAAVIDADGTFLGKYRKTHIPQVDPGFYEKFFFKPGDSGWPVFDTAYVKLGIYICYDRHFPEGWRALALNFGSSSSRLRLPQTACLSAQSTASAAKNPGLLRTTWASSMGRVTSLIHVAKLKRRPATVTTNFWFIFRDRRPETYGPLADD